MAIQVEYWPILDKGPVKLIKGVKKAHSFFTVCVRSVPLYYFKLAYVILQMAVKEFFELHFLKWRYRPFKSLEQLLANLENQLQCTTEFVPKALRQLFFALIVFIIPENMSCIHIKQ